MAAATRQDRERRSLLQTLAETVAERVREKVISGTLTPGSHFLKWCCVKSCRFRETRCVKFFRILTKEGLLRYEANRGVFVSTPSMSTIIDIYRVRRFIECSALAQAHPRHPGTQRMRLAVDDAHRCREAGNWLGVGSADISFHSAIVELADSPRLSSFLCTYFAGTAPRLRPASGSRVSARPFIDQNGEILLELEAGARGRS